jgi:hypothetical protein
MKPSPGKLKNATLAELLKGSPSHKQKSNNISVPEIESARP